MKAKTLAAKQQAELMAVLQKRFEQHKDRHKGITWTAVQKRLESNPDKLWSLNEMEATGGEPDVVALDKKSGAVIFYDCAAESPKGRRSICYDRAALDARKENKPKTSAMEMATAMGIEILTEEEYRFLQVLDSFDTKTSSWLATPTNIRKLGGAVFGDRRYDTVFLYHNGADSYYAARGFRGSLKV
jgi:hypothetical protein